MVFPPMGVVLTILRIFSQPSSSEGNNSSDRNKSSQNTRSEQTKTWQFTSSEMSDSGKAKKEERKNNSKNISGVSKGLSIAAVITLIIAAVSVIANVGSIFTRQFIENFFTLSVPTFLASGVLFLISKLFHSRDSRRARIRAIIGERESINLDKLSSASGSNVNKIKKELQKMIDKGEFGDSAYIDVGTNNFMRTPFAKPDEPAGFDYRNAYGDVLKKNKRSAKKTDDKNKENESSLDNEKNAKVTSDEDNFTTIINEIRHLNDEIKDEEVSDRIYEIEEHTVNIFDYVTDHPEAMPQIRTFMNYYLPTTLKLLESYRRIERVGIAGENMKKSKENIENILDLLVVGFKQQVDQLFKNEFIDISSDISVLEKMMQKDGLSGKSDFEIKNYSETYPKTKNDSHEEALSETHGNTGTISAETPFNTSPKSNSSSTNKVSSDTSPSDSARTFKSETHEPEYTDEISDDLISGGAAAAHPKNR